jgi:hypothetical protein
MHPASNSKGPLMAKEDEPETAQVTPTTAVKQRNRKPLLIGGIIAASVIAAGLLFGGGVFVGSHLPHGGPGMGQGQFHGPGGDQLSGPQNDRHNHD